MAMKKTGDAEKITVLRGEEASVLDEHMSRLGKFKVSDFSDEEKDELNKDLSALKEKE